MKIIEAQCPQRKNVIDYGLDVIANTCDRISGMRTSPDHRCKLKRSLCRTLLSENISANPVDTARDAINYVTPVLALGLVRIKDEKRHEILRRSMTQIDSERTQLYLDQSGAAHLNHVLTKLLDSRILTVISLGAEIKLLSQYKAVVLSKFEKDDGPMIKRFSLADFRPALRKNLQTCESKER